MRLTEIAFGKPALPGVTKERRRRGASRTRPPEFKTSLMRGIRLPVCFRYGYVRVNWIDQAEIGVLNMRMKLLSSVALAASMALAIGSVAHASTNLITNGSFSSSTYAAGTNDQFGTGFGGQGVTGWTGGSGYQLYEGTSPQTPASSQYGGGERFYDSFNAASPDGGAFVAIDGDADVRGSISQTLNNLEIGKVYTLTFDWAAGQLANRSGATTEQFAVTFGGQTINTAVLNIASGGFSGWQTATMFFTATQATQTLTFLSIGTPNGLPPMAALDGVSLTVPEPATWAMMLVGFGGIGAMIRRRRQTLVAA
ncbi:PEPxxWA-CTERM sorting domain-containing protein [Phenylobacterium sp.]|uniref:PEPxxWA-CTERM sorting domain-containing protein n=1 Tax=Phenylobacterium sp. TaxID=1871053 RepID=UPI00356282ED